MDITKLPKEVLFDLLLMVKPDEIDIVCRSKNSRVRAICSSKLFQETYKKKYPKKLMTGKISVSESNDTYTFKDKNENKIRILSVDGIITWIEYIPNRQMYPSTYVKSSKCTKPHIDERTLRRENPLAIRIKKYFHGYDFFINREYIYGALTFTDEKNFSNSRGPEVREFLEYIEKPNWYSENFKKSGKGDFKSLKEFNDEIVDVLKDVKIGEESVWRVIKPLTF